MRVCTGRSRLGGAGVSTLGGDMAAHNDPVGAGGAWAEVLPGGRGVEKAQEMRACCVLVSAGRYTDNYFAMTSEAIG